LNYHKALKQHQPDTGVWFLESEQYIKWKTDPISMLWLYGIPGCGKTILSSTVLQNVFEYCAEDPGKAVAYFYFDFNDTLKQAPELMVRSLISQLSQQSDEIPRSLELLFSTCENGQRQPLLDNLLEVLHHIIQELPQSYIILDALDECGNRTSLMQILENIASWQVDGFHLLVTSRREQDIQQLLAKLVEDRNMICLQSNTVDQDIRKYVHRRLSNDKDLQKWQKDSAVVCDIETTLMEGANGM
jgi:Cdc6-like AAA superfamily ATPase